MITRFYFVSILLITILSSTHAQEDKPQKHYMGVTLGMDPFSLIKSTIESSFSPDNDESENHYYDEDDDNSPFLMVLGAYYKFKPFNKFDFDSGYKLSITARNENEVWLNDTRYYYNSGGGHSLYSRINFSFRNIHEDGEGHICTSLETGYHYSPAKLKLYNADDELQSITKLREKNLYAEFKVGYKYGWEGQAIAFNLAINNVPYEGATYNDRKNRGFSYAGRGALIFSIDYEFSFKGNQTKKLQKQRERKNRRIIDKYEGKY